jgi:uncharacterized protein
VVAAVGTVQLDAINVLARTQFLAFFSRLGPYDSDRVLAMTGPRGELLEYWAHMASVVPVDRQPLFRWRMAAPLGRDGSVWAARHKAWCEEHADYIGAVLDEVRDRGPLAAGALSDPRRKDGEWWARRSDGRQALEWLFATGELAGWRTASFERVYDLPERVVPTAVLFQPTPSIEDAQRQLVLLAAGSLGVATIADLADYYRLKTVPTKARVAELVEDGALVAVSVEGWREPAYTLAGARPRRPTRDHATLLSPFDSLIWFRRRTERLFGFEYRIEVYTPAARRKYGYFVLPLLLGDEIVARLDLKADRTSSVLRVQAAHVEPGHDAGAVAPAAAEELDAMRAWLRLDGITVIDQGTLAPALTRAVAAR